MDVPAQEAPATDDASAGTLSGVVERVVFHNPDTGFSVLRVRVQGTREPATVVGAAGPAQPGVLVRAEGRWQTDPSYGRQFRADVLTVLPPSTKEGLAAYLASGLIKGIGPALAGRLVEAFGDRVLDVLDRQPERLERVPGIGKALAGRIAEAWRGQRAVRDIMLFLHSHGLSPLRAGRVFEAYGNDAIRIVTADPYRLARDIRGIGFQGADELAARLDIARDSPLRVRAAIAHVLGQGADEGHCGLPVEEVTAQVRQLIGVDVALVEEALVHEIGARHVVPDLIEGRQCLFLPALLRAETAIADGLARLARGTPPWPRIAAEEATRRAARRLGLELAPSQAEAVRLAVEQKLLIVTGGPGTGKTTLVRAILEALPGDGLEIELACPTGRAARRLGESTGREARTLHRLLEADPGRGFRRNAERPLACDLLVVDEMSMVDVTLMAALLDALPDEAALVLVGDVDQLPPVGPGQVLADLIASERLPVLRLTEIFRQAAESRIVLNAHRVNQGLMPEARGGDELSDFYAIRAADAEDARTKLLQLVTSRIPERFAVDPTQDIQVLVPTNRGPLGAQGLNELLQPVLNPGGAPRITRERTAYAVGDKVMQTENDYEKEVYNGDLGRIAGIDEPGRSLVVDFDGRGVAYGFGDLDRLVPAWAITVHKAQGSEYPVVVLPLARHHGRMLRRDLVYTAITRARRLVVIVSEGQALETAVTARALPRRWTRLQGLLRSLPEPT
jgi:exodeoxyribonuclease V alpha subunit